MGKRGPRRKPGKREGNGQLSRVPVAVAERLKDALDRDERETIAVGVEARQRVFGVAPDECRDQRAGSVVGRLRMRGELSQPQFEAAVKWQEGAERYSWAVGSAVAKPPQAVDLNRVHGSPTASENVALVRKFVAAYREADKVVREAQLELKGRGNLFGALDAIILRDVELAHLVPDLRCALNALAKHYRFEERRAA
jgi:hypothetical protein